MVDMVGSAIIIWNQQRPSVHANIYAKRSNVDRVEYNQTENWCSFIADSQGGCVGRTGEGGVDTILAGHKYLSVVYVKTETPGVPLTIYTDAGLGTVNMTTQSAEWTKVHKFFTYGTTIVPNEAFTLYDNRRSGWDNVYFKNPMRFDLTEIFGEGNEPTTIEEFERYFPDEYYKCTQGESVLCVPDTVISYTKSGDILDAISVSDVPHQINVEAGGIIEVAYNSGTSFMVPV